MELLEWAVDESMSGTVRKETYTSVMCFMYRALLSNFSRQCENDMLSL